MSYQLAQLNIATMKAPLDSPVMAVFVDNLERINALAERSPGFVWRLQDEAGDATAIRPFGDDILVNMSVWESVESLADYAFRSEHVEIMRRRREWFGRMDQAHAVLWWVPTGHRPTLAEAADRLQRLRADGPGPDAFTFREPFPPPGAATQAAVPSEDECPA